MTNVTSVVSGVDRSNMATTPFTFLGSQAGSRITCQLSSRQLPRGIENIRSSTGYALEDLVRRIPQTERQAAEGPAPQRPFTDAPLLRQRRVTGAVGHVAVHRIQPLPEPNQTRPPSAAASGSAPPVRYAPFTSRAAPPL